MRQYNEIKARNPDAVLLYRMGDFYEMFNDDAKIASKVLGLTLTSRNNGSAESTPLAGFPYHALDRYANRLVKAGYAIAICEQTEDPKAAKGIVKRDIIEIVTAGTATEECFLEEKTNNFIMSLCRMNGSIGAAVCDLSTGQFEVEEAPAETMVHEMMRVEPSELLVSSSEEEYFTKAYAENYRKIVVSPFDPWKFSYDTASAALKNHFQVASLDGWGLETRSGAVCAAGALLLYLKEQKKNDLRHISSMTLRTLSAFAELDPSTIRNLELLQPLQNDEADGTLVSVLDKTGTAMGGRLLKRFITRPLREVAAISERLTAVERLRKDTFCRAELGLLLKRVADIERLVSRISLERAGGRDLVSLRSSLEVFPNIIRLLAETETTSPLLSKACEALQGFELLVRKISDTIVDNPPNSIREGGIIRPGISKELDAIREAATSGKQWIGKLQENERKRTGISTLKVGYNRVFGYYIEISRANASNAPADYIRKQTLTNGERFITPELKAMEDKVLSAEECLSTLEYELFVSLRISVAAESSRILAAAEAIALIDVLVSFAQVAAEYNYCRPMLIEEPDLVIRDGRHPVVERMVASGTFVPNDLDLIKKESQILLITGPNMAGKSTYLRQNALICIMAQMGSFVPASFAQVGIVDRFFTRVGAADRLARGLSTFLVEMIEVANILNNATDRSLVLLDEVGRGTSTFDGISIAWAVAEYLHETTGRRCRTLFATHYHELTEMALLFSRIKNVHVKVKEWNEQIIFLRKIDHGSCDHSYGIQVARLAGVPRKVIIRAREILANLENMEFSADHTPMLARRGEMTAAAEQTSLFYASGSTDAGDGLDPAAEIVERLHVLDVDALTPIDAMNVLAELKRKAEQV
jgi:DNA mismatch repair protein MutS